MAHYIHDENHNRIEAYSAEEVLSILEQAIEDGDLEGITPDSGFITKFLNKADGNTYGIAFCTQAQYNEMEQGGTLETNVIYYITDDDSYDDLVELVEQLQSDVAAAQASITTFTQLVNQILDGTTVVANATHAVNADNANFAPVYKHTITASHRNANHDYVFRFTFYSATSTQITSISNLSNKLGLGQSGWLHWQDPDDSSSYGEALCVITGLSNSTITITFVGIYSGTGMQSNENINSDYTFTDSVTSV